MGTPRKAKTAKPAKPATSLRLDLGCGTNKKDGFLGVDIEAFPGVDQVVDLRKIPWPWKDASVEEIHCSHFLEHLTGPERIDFFNELYRVMTVGAKAMFITPHWSSGRAYGDVTHQWPPVVEMFWYYLSKLWREGNPKVDPPQLPNAPHVGLRCNFEVTWGYILANPWPQRSQETQAFALNHYREVAQDMVATATKLADA